MKISAHIENIRKYQAEVTEHKNKVTKLKKKTLRGFNGRLDKKNG